MSPLSNGRRRWLSRLLASACDPDLIVFMRFFVRSRRLRSRKQCSFHMALAAWGHHARMMVKNGSQINIYDPWKQRIAPPSWVREALEGTPYTLNFVARAADQAFGEGSCQLQALTRLLMMALYGEEEGMIPWTTERPEMLAVPVAVQLLISRLRVR